MTHPAPQAAPGPVRAGSDGPAESAGGSLGQEVGSAGGSRGPAAGSAGDSLGQEAGSAGNSRGPAAGSAGDSLGQAAGSRREPVIAGVLLAAGSGKRYGGPKALADTGSGPWVLRALGTLAGLAPLVVVLGAASERVRELLPANVRAVDNPQYESGMGSSLASGLRALAPAASAPAASAPAAPAPAPGTAAPGAPAPDPGAPAPVDAAVIMLVDLPDVPAEAVSRVVAATRAHARNSVIDMRESLARASFHGRPGHPVLIGAAHFDGVIAAAVGDRGARDYLAGREVLLVECGDLGSGADRDTPAGADR